MPNERDKYHRKTPPAGVQAQSASPDPVWDDATQKYERGEISDDELKESRRNRSPSRRLDRLEDQQSDLSKIVTQTVATTRSVELAVAEIKGELEGQNRVLEDIRIAVKDRQTVHTTMMMAEIDVTKEQAKASITDAADAAKVTRADALDAKQTRRKLILLIAGAIFSAGVVSAIVQHLLGKL